MPHLTPHVLLLASWRYLISWSSSCDALLEIIHIIRCKYFLVRVKSDFIIIPGEFFSVLQTKMFIASGSENNVSLRHSPRPGTYFPEGNLVLLYTSKVYISTYIILLLLLCVIVCCVHIQHSAHSRTVPCCLFHTTAHHELPTICQLENLLELSTRNSTAKTELAS